MSTSSSSKSPPSKRDTGFGFDPFPRFFRESGEAEPGDFGSGSAVFQLAS
jgi:hypothetical protein